MVFECGRRLAIDGVSHDLGRDERVAVSVAADPRPHRHDVGSIHGPVGTGGRSECALEILGERRDHLEEAGSVVPDRLVDLVTNAQLGEPEQRRLPEQQDTHRQLLVELGALDEVVGDPAALVEQAGNFLEHFEDRLATDLCGVGGDDGRHPDLGTRREQLLRRHAGDEEAVDGRTQTARARCARPSPLVSTTTFDVHVLGGVRQQREPVERPQHQELLGERAAAQCVTNRCDRTRAGAATVDGELANPFDEFECLVALGRPNGVAEQPSEQTDVGAHEVGCSFGGRGEIRHSSSQARGRPDWNT